MAPARADSFDDRGETLVEGIVAVGIIGLVVVGLTGLVGTSISLGSTRDAQALSEAVTRSLYESVTALHAPVGATLTCADTTVIADIARTVDAIPLPDGVTVATPVVRSRYLAATSGTPAASTSTIACPGSSAPAGSVPLGLAVTIDVSVAGAGPGGQAWTDTMTASVIRRL